MTFATKITCLRILAAPIFAVAALMYGYTVAIHAPNESFRFAALAIFIAASVSDGLDGWIARRFNQISELGAFLDPLADKTLILTACLVLSVSSWNDSQALLPWWFTVLIYTRDLIIIFGLEYLQKKSCSIHFAPHWSGKASTIGIYLTLAWFMLKGSGIPDSIPCILTSLLVILSGITYIRIGYAILHGTSPTPPAPPTPPFLS